MGSFMHGDLFNVANGGASLAIPRPPNGRVRKEVFRGSENRGAHRRGSELAALSVLTFAVITYYLYARWTGFVTGLLFGAPLAAPAPAGVGMRRASCLQPATACPAARADAAVRAGTIAFAAACPLTRALRPCGRRGGWRVDRRHHPALVRGPRCGWARPVLWH
jgi:hypothetical protein